MVRKPLIAALALAIIGVCVAPVAAQDAAPAAPRPNRRAAGPSLGDVLKAAVQAGAATTRNAASASAPPRDLAQAPAQPAPVPAPPPLTVPAETAAAAPVARRTQATRRPVTTAPRLEATKMPFGRPSPPLHTEPTVDGGHRGAPETIKRLSEAKPKAPAGHAPARPPRSEGRQPDTTPAAAPTAESSSGAKGVGHRAASIRARAVNAAKPEMVATAPPPTPAPTLSPAPAPTAAVHPAAKPRPDGAHVAALTPPARVPDEAIGQPALSLGFEAESDALNGKSSEALRRFADAFAMRDGRLQIVAYATSPDKSLSAARRLSLKRALVVREVLLERGIPSTRIDVRALGGTDVAGDSNRLDLVIEQGPSTEPPFGGPSSGG